MKDSVHALALFGGASLFEEPLHVGRPNLPTKSKFISRVDEIWERGWLTNNGPVVQEFEARLSDRLGVKHCISISNATRALEIAISALGMTGEVIVPAFTFVATAHSVKWQGLKPVFCDVLKETHCIDPREAEALITEKTTGIIPVNLWGGICEIEAIDRLAERYNLSVLYDSSHAFDCSHKGNKVGGFGDAEVFSFHATKVFSTFEGGCISTNNDELAEKIRLLKNFGFVDKDKVVYLGTNGKMNEVAAAMGLASLEELDTFIDRNRDNYLAYKKSLEGLDYLSLISHPKDECHNFHYVVVELADEAELSRDQLVRILESEGILARRYFYPGCHNMEPYRSEYQGVSFPETDRLCARVICLPNGSAVDSKAIGKIASLLDFVLSNQREIKQLFQESRL